MILIEVDEKGVCETRKVKTRVKNRVTLGGVYGFSFQNCIINGQERLCMRLKATYHIESNFGEH